MADKSLTPIDLPELSSAPASPASGFHRFYAKTDGKAYSKSSAGTEYDLTASGGAAGYTIVSKSGATYTLVIGDANTFIRYSHTTAATVTIPLNSSVPFAIGSIINIEQTGAGVVTVTNAVGVTINSTAKKTWGQYSVIELYKVDTDTWNVIGGSV